jgi:F-type H+-transporting ATPase subunit a
MVKESIGADKEGYLPFIYSMFFFILFANLFGNVPYSFAITSSVMVCMGLSVTIFLGVTILAMYKHGFNFATFFLPAGTPTVLVPLLVVIELVSYVSRAFSLGVRLFANIVAGHALLNILSGMIYKIMCSGIIAAVLSIVPLVIFLALVGLELAVSLIQSFVFCVLLSSYVHDAEFLH